MAENSEMTNKPVLSKVSLISEEERSALRRQTAAVLPDSPAATGMPASAVKPAFWRGFVGDKYSLVAFFNRMAEEMNVSLDEIAALFAAAAKKSEEDAAKSEAALDVHKTDSDAHAALFAAAAKASEDNAAAVSENMVAAHNTDEAAHQNLLTRDKLVAKIGTVPTTIWGNGVGLMTETQSKNLATLTNLLYEKDPEFIDNLNEVLAAFEGMGEDATLINLIGEKANRSYVETLVAEVNEKIGQNEPALEDHKVDSNAHAELFGSVDKRIGENKAAIDALGGKVTRNDKRLTNLEKGLAADTFETDAEVAYIKTVPKNALPYAAVDKVGGMSYKCKNLLDLVNSEKKSSQSISNFSYEIVDGEILKTSYSGPTNTSSYLNIRVFLDIDLSTLTNLYVSCLAKPVGFTKSNIGIAYISKTDNSVNGVTTISQEGEATFSKNFLIQEKYRGSEYQLALLFYALCGEATEQGGSIEYSNIMVATEEMPYEKYFEGLRSAPVTEMQSLSVNILDIQSALNDCLVDNKDGTYTITKVGDDRFSAKVPFNVPANTNLNAYIEIVDTNIENASRIRLRFLDKNNKAISPTSYMMGGGADIVTGGDCYYCQLYLLGSEADGAYITFRKPMISFGKGAREYAPYSKHTLPIPEAVRSIEGYGLGVDATYHNYIDYERKVFVQGVEKIAFDGSENWRTGSTAEHPYFQLNLEKAPAGDRIGIMNDYNFASVGSTGGTIGWNLLVSGYVRIRPDLSLYPDVASWKAHLAERAANGNPITIIYGVAEHSEIDISDILPADNLLEVEDGGTITAVNEHEYAVPSEIIYQVKEVAE